MGLQKKMIKTISRNEFDTPNGYAVVHTVYTKREGYETFLFTKKGRFKLPYVFKGVKIKKRDRKYAAQLNHDIKVNTLKRGVRVLEVLNNRDRELNEVF